MRSFPPVTSDGRIRVSGAESLIHTLVAEGVEVCFVNPGTSEIHIVAALNRISGVRCVLGLFEGVVTGAADGYYRMTGEPAATLLHLGPGLANGLASLHNARKARSGIVNIVGQHATDHIAHNAPLTSDIEGIARPVSEWVRTSANADEIGADCVEAIEAARECPAKIATLIVPADAAWSEAAPVERPRKPAKAKTFSPEAVDIAAGAARKGATTLLLAAGEALSEPGLAYLEQVARKTGCQVLAPTMNAKASRGCGRMYVNRIPYIVDLAIPMLSEFRDIVLIEAPEPVGFFAYPGKPSLLKAEGCRVHRLSAPGDDTVGALAVLADALRSEAGDHPMHQPVELVKPTGPLTHETIAQAIACAIPENAIVFDEAITTGRNYHWSAAAAAPPHDLLQNVGGAIGFSPSASVGAAIACPDRKVICMVGDGSAMYSLQALWTQARVALDVTTIIFSNRGYKILGGEYAALGEGKPGPRVQAMLELDRPKLDWTALAAGMGVPGRAVSSADELNAALDAAMSSDGPKLIEVNFLTSDRPASF